MNKRSNSALKSDAEYERVGDDGAFIGGYSRKKKLTVAAVAICIIIFIFGAVGVVFGTTWFTSGARVQIWKTLQVTDVTQHLQELQHIANGTELKNRACGTVGYNRSLEYVKSQLDAVNVYYDVQVQEFVAQSYSIMPSVFKLVTPIEVPYIQGTQFEIVTNSIGGSVTGPLTAVANYGCNATDYGANITIALVQRALSTDPAWCSVQTVATLAGAAGAQGVVLVMKSPNDRPRLISGKSRGDSLTPMPMLAVVTSVGAALFAAQPPPSVAMVVNGTQTSCATANVIATTRTGDSTNVIVVGSHLDSVPAGPGINDNGSGTSSNLAVALAMARAEVNVTSQVRFCWWAAEEMGLLGSTHYVRQLNASEFNKILLNINIDMLASPNYVQFVDSVNRNSTSIANATVTASANIERLLAGFFDQIGVPHRPTQIDVPGRSDYAPFLDNGVPAAGLACGAEVLKNADEQHVFGGLQGAQFDPCYHMPCDTYPENIATTALFNNVRSLANAVQVLATHENARNWLYGNRTAPPSNAEVRAKTDERRRRFAETEFDVADMAYFARKSSNQ